MEKLSQKISYAQALNFCEQLFAHRNGHSAVGIIIGSFQDDFANIPDKGGYCKDINSIISDCKFDVKFIHKEDFTYTDQDKERIIGSRKLIGLTFKEIGDRLCGD